MTFEAERDDTATVERDYDAPPAKVWRALTEDDLVERWLADPDEVDPPPVEREVVESEPPRRLRVRWREGAVDGEVTFTLTPTFTGGTRLRVTHARHASARRMAA